MTFTIKDALREAVTAHHDGTKLLERSVLGVYKMKNLSQLLATDEGEDKVIQRLQVIDMARNIINSMAIDNDGEDYQYINASMSGASDIIDRTCNMLSAVTDIQQTILFGKDPAGEEATGDNDRDNYFQLLNRIQTNSYKNASTKVVKLVLKAMVADGTQEKDIPQYEVRFNPMKQLSEEEQANIDSIKAGTAQTKAATAQVYVDMQALDPSEVRKGLADSNDYQIQGIVENDNLEIPEEAYDLRKQFAELNQIGGEGEDNGTASAEEEMQQAADNPAENGMMNADDDPDTHIINDLGSGGRAFYSSGTGQISVSPEDKSKTYYHEYGHKIEAEVPGVHEVVMEFYNRRTAGEKSNQLLGYENGEVTKKDSFVDPYIGKDYNGTATEVLSMGLQYAYTDNVAMMRDTDMSQLIYGILAVM